MQLTLDDKASPWLIRGYGDGELRIGNETYTSSVQITQNGVEPWPNDSIEALVDADWTALLNSGARILIVGTGAAIAFPPPAATASLAEKGIGVEFMDTAAACRTFNVLANEGRPVAAILFI